MRAPMLHQGPNNIISFARTSSTGFIETLVLLGSGKADYL